MVYVKPTADLMDGTTAHGTHYGLAGIDQRGDTNLGSNASLNKNHPTTVRLGKTTGEGSSLESSKQILLIDDNADSCFAIKTCLETYFRKDLGLPEPSLQITTFSDPIEALRQFKPYYYDLLLVDINMPSINGYELVEKIVRLDLNIKICFMTAGEINYEAITEIRHPARSFGCFIKKPATNDYLINRVMQELY